jgi:sulfur-carrier protein
MPKVELRLYATLHQYLPDLPIGDGKTLEVAEGTTVRQLLEQVGAPVKTSHQVFVNSRKAGLDHPVADGDEIAVFPPIGGGQRGRVEA